MDLSDFDRRLSRPVRMRANEFQRDGRLKHVLFSAQFSRELLERLLSLIHI